MADHTVRIRYSKDGGRNWSNWKEKSIGAIGEYQQRVQWHQFGEARTIIFEIAVSSPRKRDLMGAVANIEQTNG